MSLPETGLHDNQRILKREAERSDRRNIHIDSEVLLNRKNIVGTLQIYKLWERDKEKPQEELIQLWELDVWRRTEEIHMSMRKSGFLQKDSDEEKKPEGIHKPMRATSATTKMAARSVSCARSRNTDVWFRETNTGLSRKKKPGLNGDCWWLDMISSSWFD